MNFRVNFEKGTLRSETTVCTLRVRARIPQKVECDTENGYYKEVKYFATLVENPDMVNTINPPEASMDTIKLVCAEEESADNFSKIVEL